MASDTFPRLIDTPLFSKFFKAANFFGILPQTVL